MDGYQTLTINDFRGGIVEEGRRGPRGSSKFVQGLDIRSGENTLKCQQALKKDSASVVTDLVLVIVPATDGNVYAFGDTGKVYQKTGGSWRNVYTDPDGKITGATEFKSTSNTFLLYATQTKLKKITLASADTASWSTPTTVGSFINGNDNFHSMRNAIGVVLINDGDVQALYDYEDAFNNAALRMPTGTVGRSIWDRKNRVYIGDRNDVLKSGMLIEWDRLADSWLDKESAKGWGINAIEDFEGGALCQVGNNGALRYFNLNTITSFKRIPFTGEAYPGGITTYNELVHVGMFGGTRDGVYSIGRLDKNDPLAIALEYVPSHGKTTGCVIGAVQSTGDDLLVSWKDDTTYGIDNIDTANKAEGIYESLRNTMSKAQVDKLVEWIKVNIKDMPDGCSIEVKWRSSGDSYTAWKSAELADGDTETGVDEEDSDGSKIIFKAGAQGEEYEVQVLLHPSGNTTPEILSINSYFNFLGGV